MYEYDLESDRWATKKPLPTARGALAVGVYQSTLYTVWGYADGQNSSANQKYNPILDRWEPRPRCPLPEITWLWPWWRIPSMRWGED